MNEAATEATKTSIENSVSWYLSEKLQGVAMPIVTVKYLTNDNVLISLTLCSVAETNVPRIKVQVFTRVEGGVTETGYQLYSDHRFEKYITNMIFGSAPNQPGDSPATAVTEAEAQQLVALLGSLATTAHQTV